MAAEVRSTCYSQFNEIFNSLTGQFEKEIRQKLFRDSVWFTLIKRDKWPDFQGEEIKTTTFENKLPTNENTDWPDAFSGNANDDSYCIPQKETIRAALTNRTYTLQAMAFESDPICLDKLRTGTMIAETLEKTKAMLVRYLKRKWANFYRLGFYNNTSTKLVVKTTGVTEIATSFETANQLPTGKLNIGVLQDVYAHLIEEGAGDFAYGQADGAPVLACVIGQQEKHKLILGNPDIRDDVRWAKPYENLSYLGVKSYSNLAFITEIFPMRFDTDAEGNLVYISTFMNVAATKGDKTIINPDWHTARFEVAWVFTSGVFDVVVPTPMSTLGAGTTFKPINYVGEFKWVNEYDKDCNPDGNIGYWRAVCKAGRRPIFPELGRPILFKRCQLDNEVVACTNTPPAVYS